MNNFYCGRLYDKNFNIMGCNCGKKSIATKKNTVVKTPKKVSGQMPKRIIRRTSK